MFCFEYGFVNIFASPILTKKMAYFILAHQSFGPLRCPMLAPLNPASMAFPVPSMCRLGAPSHNLGVESCWETFLLFVCASSHGRVPKTKNGTGFNSFAPGGIRRAGSAFANGSVTTGSAPIRFKLRRRVWRKMLNHGSKHSGMVMPTQGFAIAFVETNAWRVV